MIRVMIVAAYIEVGEGLSTVLRLAGGFEIGRIAASLDDAIRQASLERPDVILVDLEMPGGEGYETLHQLSRLCQQTVLVALTAHDYPSARERAIQAGASIIMVKGTNVPEMAAAIQAAVGSKL